MLSTGKIQRDNIDLLALKQAGVIPADALTAKVILSGEITSAIKVQGLGVTKVHAQRLKRPAAASLSK